MNGTIELRDGDALEILADKWRKANRGYGTNEGEISGDDVIALVEGLLTETGRPLVFTPATVNNMHRYVNKHENDAHAPKAIAVSLGGTEEYSARSGDHFSDLDVVNGAPLKDENGEPMILAVRTSKGLRDALTGAPVHV